jgi:hypothetical protein
VGVVPARRGVVEPGVISLRVERAVLLEAERDFSRHNPPLEKTGRKVKE